jgi:Co/Zn/Cd efflux system component
MPDIEVCRNSGAILYKQTPEERKVTDLRKQLEKEVKEVQKLKEQLLTELQEIQKVKSHAETES